MQKTVKVVGVLLALGALGSAGRLVGQTQPTGPGPASVQGGGAKQAPAGEAPRTHIALINLTYVMKHYTKFVGFQEEMKRIIKPHEETRQKLLKDAEELNKKGQTSPTDARALIERQLKDIQRKMEDNAAELNLKLQQSGDAQIRVIYQDVVAVAQQYAREHDFDLVLQYNDAITDPEYWSPKNISRKLQTGALMPLYAASGMDISQAVVEILNYNIKGAMPATNVPQTPAGGVRN